MNPIYTKDDFIGLDSVLHTAGRVFVVCDEAVKGLVAEIVASAGLEGEVPALCIRSSEDIKSLRTVEAICRFLLENSADRTSFLLAVGGGICCDMAGFAASVYMRGIRFAYIPTTLLAASDAAIGGKTGVNFMGFKNMIGCFIEPEFTWIAARSLTGLPAREVKSGAAEIFKSFIIDNTSGAYEEFADFLAGLDGSWSCGGDSEWICDGPTASRLLHFASAAAQVKAGIVERDFREGGERRKLNLGHTFAHAIEHLSREDGSGISHGEAVAMGIVFAAQLSEALGGAEKGLAEDIRTRLEAAGLRTVCPYPPTLLAGAMSKDKKAESDGVNFVLIHGIGDVYIQKLLPQEAMFKL